MCREKSQFPYHLGIRLEEQDKSWVGKQATILRIIESSLLRILKGYAVDEFSEKPSRLLEACRG